MLPGTNVQDVMFVSVMKSMVDFISQRRLKNVHLSQSLPEQWWPGDTSEEERSS